MTELIDSTITKRTVQDGFSNVLDRIRHFSIDGILTISLWMLLFSFVSNGTLYVSREIQNYLAVIIALVIYISYYTLLEYFFGFTLGKWVNKTRVININDSKTTFNQILIRTFSRLIPFGIISILTPYKAAAHDLLSKTRTIRIKKKYISDMNAI